MGSTSKKFRDTFKISKEIVHWYPGHMKSGFIHMQAKMRVIDCIIEVHDSRVPFTGRNPLFVKNLIGTKPHILVLNKIDLINTSSFKQILQKHKEEGQENIVFVNSLNQSCKGLKKIVPSAVKLIGESLQTPKVDNIFKMMVIGIPNVGKSSLINALRNAILHRGKATAVGAIAGITRSLQNEIKVNEDPPIFLIDTPGILNPRISDTEDGMKLALCSCLKDDLVGMTTIADFLLYWMNKTRNFKYVEHFNIKEPIDNVLPLLVKIAMNFDKTVTIKNVNNNKLEKLPDLQYAAYHLVKLFRKGNFGDLNLDCLKL